MINRIPHIVLASVLLFTTHLCIAEQMIQMGEYEVHYIVIPTTFLDPKIADQYNLPRGRDRALVNISVIDSTGSGSQASISGTSRNLLGQIQQLEFTEVAEDQAIYYLALLRHDDEEHHRFEINVGLPDGQQATLKFRQKMYWKDK